MLEKATIIERDIVEIPPTANNPLELIATAYQALKSDADFFIAGGDYGQSPEQTLTQGSIAYLYIAFGNNLDIAIDCINLIVRKAEIEHKKQQINLNAPLPSRDSKHGIIYLGNALVHFAKGVKPTKVRKLLPQIVRMRALNSETATEIICVADKIDEYYPGGIEQWLEHIDGLGPESTDKWLSVAAEGPINSAEQTQAFVTIGREIVASYGDKIGCWWFVYFNRNEPVDQIRNKGKIAHKIATFVTTSISDPHDQEVVFSQLLDLTENHELADLEKGYRQIAEYHHTLGTKGPVLDYEAYFEDLFERKTPDWRNTDTYSKHPLAVAHCTTYDEEVRKNIGEYPPYPQSASCLYWQLIRIGVGSSDALSIVGNHHKLPEHDLIQPILTTAPAKIIVVGQHITNWNHVSDFNPENEHLEPLIQKQRSLKKLKRDLIKAGKKAGLKVESISDEISKKLVAIEKRINLLLTAKVLPGETPLVRHVLLAEVLPCHPRHAPSGAMVVAQPKETTRNAAKIALANWAKERSTFPGLLVIGGKIHVYPGINTDRFRRIKKELGITSTSFRLAHAQESIILPAGQAADLIRLVRTLVWYGLFRDKEVDLQLCIAGRWPEDVASIVGASIILGSDQGVLYKPGAFSTNRNNLTDARIMAYDDGVKWNKGPFDLPLAKGRTDMLGRHAGVDIRNYQVLGTLASHYVYEGRWKHLFETYRDNFLQILKGADLLAALSHASWVYNGEKTKNDTVFAHEQMVRVFSQAWIDAQSQANEGVVGAVRALIHQTMSEIFHQRAVTRALYPSDCEALHKPRFVYGE